MHIHVSPHRSVWVSRTFWPQVTMSQRLLWISCQRQISRFDIIDWACVQMWNALTPTESSGFLPCLSHRWFILIKTVPRLCGHNIRVRLRCHLVDKTPTNQTPSSTICDGFWVDYIGVVDVQMKYNPNPPSVTSCNVWTILQYYYCSNTCSITTVLLL